MRTAKAGLLALLTTCCAHNPKPAPPPGPQVALISPYVRNDVAFTYEMVTRNNGLEFARCLHGQAGPLAVKVDYTRPPFTHYATSDSISFTCERTEDYLGPAHSHPQRHYDTCVPSARDLIHFIQDKKAVMMAIFCNENTILGVFRPPQEDSVLTYLRSVHPRTPVEVRW